MIEADIFHRSPNAVYFYTDGETDTEVNSTVGNVMKLYCR